MSFELSLPRPNGNGKIKPGKHPNSLANLEKTKFKKGQSGNPSGRYKGVSRAYMKFLQEKDPATGLTNEELIAKNIIAEAQGGGRNNVVAAKELRQSTEETEEGNKGLNVGNISVNILAMMQKLAISNE